MKSSFAVIFDMDGVIIDSNPVHKIALKQFCKNHGHELDEQQLRDKIYGRTNKDWIPNVFPGIDDKKLKQYADEKEALYRELYTDIKPLAGLIPFLQVLGKHQVSIAIGTSAPRENVDFTLKNTETEKFFTTILDESFVNKGKPDPEIYIKCAAALGYPTSSCVVFEDSISGVLAGKAAGCKVVGVTTSHSAEELGDIDMSIADFNDVTVSDIERLLNNRINRYYLLASFACVMQILLAT